jgi:hypothetical protein
MSNAATGLRAVLAVGSAIALCLGGYWAVALVMLPLAAYLESIALALEWQRADSVARKAPPPAPEPPGAPDRPRTPPEDPDRLAAALLRREREELERRHFGGTA